VKQFAKDQVWLDLHSDARYRILRVYKYCCRVKELRGARISRPLPTPYNITMRHLGHCMLLNPEKMKP